MYGGGGGYGGGGMDGGMDMEMLTELMQQMAGANGADLDNMVRCGVRCETPISAPTRSVYV